MTDTAAKGGARPRPSYGARKVDAIPDDITLPRTGPRPDPKFLAGLQDCIAEPNTPFMVGEFQSENGAKNLHKRIEQGEIKIPAGDWIFETRRVWAPDSTDDNPKRWSRLYAIYEGPVEQSA